MLVMPANDAEIAKTAIKPTANPVCFLTYSINRNQRVFIDILLPFQFRDGCYFCPDLSFSSNF